jgi:hypothetical protein
MERGRFEGRDAPEDVDASQAEFEEGMRELEEKRLELADEGDDVVDDNFRWVLRGGTWTAHRTGLSYDCFMALARPGSGASCARPATASASTANSWLSSS